jgi:hypothetical protein
MSSIQSTRTVLNSTYETCGICLSLYEPDEKKNPSKVVEVVCKHLFHIACLSEAVKTYASDKDRLNCPYCRCQFVCSEEKIAHVLSDQEQFELFISKMKSIYQYDPEVIRLYNLLQEIYPTIREKWAAFLSSRSSLNESQREEHTKKFISELKDFICDSSSIPDLDKSSIVLMIRQMIIGEPRAIRSIQMETIRWMGKEFPAEILENGVLVRFNDASDIRVSSDYLRQYETYLVSQSALKMAERDAAWLISLASSGIQKIRYMAGRFFELAIRDNLI